MARFEKGKSGNPRGRPKGVIDRRNRYRSLIESRLPDVIDQVITSALGGDMTACKLLLDKLVPNVRSVSPAMCLSGKNDSAGALSASIVAEMMSGSLAPDQAATAMSVLSAHSQLVDSADLISRLHALEEKLENA